MFLLATFVWALALFFLSCRGRSPLTRVLAALGSGVLLGNLVATKWFGIGAVALVWAWIGLAVLARRRNESAAGEGAVPKGVRGITSLFFFLVVPALTYLLWTVPLVGIPGSVRAAMGEELFAGPCTFGRTPDQRRRAPTTWLGRVRHWHCTVWNYHSHLTATHPYGSSWWSWPILRHPVLFYVNSDGGSPRRISATGNPVIWWAAFAVVWVTVAMLAFRRLARRITGALLPLPDLWLLFGIFGFWLPWAFIQRVTFHYHYFLSFTLSVVLLALWLTRLLDRPRFRAFPLLFLGAALVGFVVLYPSASALPAFWVR